MDEPVILAVAVERDETPQRKAVWLIEEGKEGYDACLLGLDVEYLHLSVGEAVQWMRAFDCEYDRLAAANNLARGRYPLFVALIPDGLSAIELARWGQSGMRVVPRSRIAAGHDPIEQVGHELREDWLAARRMNQRAAVRSDTSACAGH